MNDKDTSIRPKPQEKAKPKGAPKRRRRWVRMLLGLLRTLLVPALCALALYVGLWIGYSYVAGADAEDILDWSTWRHLFDLVFSS